MLILGTDIGTGCGSWTVKRTGHAHYCATVTWTGTLTVKRTSHDHNWDRNLERDMDREKDES